MKNIGILDAEIIFKGIYSEFGKHRFPNLASMKISGYHKAIGDNVILITEIPNLPQLNNWSKTYDKIYISKVFVETSVPIELLRLPNVVYGGTGFFFSGDQPLIPSIEHHMPDYHLYDNWIKERKTLQSSTDEFSYYEDYSMGFATRGCIRGCKFCINQHCNKVVKASPIKEFFNPDRPKICLLDDNILAYEGWREVFDELNATGKWFEFKQGLDIRALNEEKAEVITNSNININTIYFAFDNIKDKPIIEEKLKLWRQYYRKNTHMYVLCGFDENNMYDEDFWAKDIEDTLERIKICIQYGVFPYVMRHRMYNTAPTLYRGMYINLASWCNQKSLFSKLSLNEWADNIQKAIEKQRNKKKLYSSKRYMMQYAGSFPDIAYEYFDLKYNEHNEYIYEKNTRKQQYGKKKRQNIVFAIKHLKNKVHIHQIDKTRKRKTAVEVSNSISSVKLPVLNWFEDIQQIFNNGYLLNLNRTTLQPIKNNSINSLFLNIKNEIFDDYDEVLLKSCGQYLNNEGNLYICNINLKSFTLTKEFIEKNTNLKFKEVVNFNTDSDKKEIRYCSRYSLVDRENIFDVNKSYVKNLLFEDIIKHSTKENDIILSFFDSYHYFQDLGEKYNRHWICFKKRGHSSTKSAVTFLNQMVEDNQISMLNEQNKQDIG